MYARLARYEVPDGRAEDAVRAFEEAARDLEGLNGLQGGYVLRDADTGGIVTMTLWEHRALMESSEVRAARLRQRAVRRVEGSVASVQCLEVEVEIAATKAAV